MKIIMNNLIYSIILYFLYGFLYMLMPAVILYPAIKHHSLGYRIMMYQISALTYVSLVSFGLCFAGIYNTISTWICFVIGPAVIRLVISRQKVIEWIEKHREKPLYQESMKSRLRRYRKHLQKMLFFGYRNYIKGRIFQYITALFIIYFIFAKFGYFHLTYYTYSCSDEATHIYWVNSLIHGNPFPVGIYPHGMHFMVGAFCSMFGLVAERAWLSFGVVSVSVIFLSIYLFAKLICGSGFSAVSGILIFIFYNGIASGGWYGRLFQVMPMEFAMFAVLTMCYGMVAWSRDDEWCSLAVFGMGVLGTTLIHPFSTIVAFFIVAAFFFLYHNEMVRKKILHRFILCGIAAVIVAVLPYVIGLTAGFHLEQSFSWGAAMVSSASSSDSDDDIADSDDLSILTDDSISDSDDIEKLREKFLVTGTIEDVKSEEDDSLNQGNLISYVLSLIGSIMTKSLTKTETGGLFLLGCEILTLIYSFWKFIISKKNKELNNKYRMRLFVSCAWLSVFVFLYLFTVYHVMQLMVLSRTSGYLGLFSVIIYAEAIQVFCDFLKKIKSFGAGVDCLCASALCSSFFVYVSFINREVWTGRLYGFVLENADVETEEYLISKAEKGTWTIISTTNARMAILYDGYLYEITDLLLSVKEKNELYIPTSDIYVVVENRVPLMGDKQVDGSDFIETSNAVSVEYAQKDITYYIEGEIGAVDSDVYLGNTTRMGIMSHLFYWMEEIKTAYPNEVSVFLQDDTCTIYHISQDPYFLLNLAVDYSDQIEHAAEVLASTSSSK